MHSSTESWDANVVCCSFTLFAACFQVETEANTASSQSSRIAMPNSTSTCKPVKRLSKGRKKVSKIGFPQVECTLPGCKAQVRADGMSRHMKLVHADHNLVLHRARRAALKTGTDVLPTSLEDVPNR